MQNPSILSVGVGSCFGHHGEFLQGVFSDARHRLHRGLLTVPCPLFVSRATFWPDESDQIVVRPSSSVKAAAAAERALKAVGYGRTGGAITLESNIPAGAGFGSSTADVIATIRAVSDAATIKLPRNVESKIAIDAERASDPLAFADQPLLFGHRSGELIETFNGDFPRMTIVGFRTGDPPVDTDRLPPARYTIEEIETFGVLRAHAARAVASGDGDSLGRLASTSAWINQKHLPKSRLEEVIRMSQDVKSWGVQVAHSGNIAGLLFPADAEDRIISGMEQLDRVGFEDIRRFTLPAPMGQ